MDLAAALSALTLVGLAATAVAGWFHAYCALLLTTLFVLPGVIVGSVPEDAVRVGITGAHPRLMTYTVAIAIGLLVAVTKKQPTGLHVRAALPFTLFLPAWGLAVWGIDSEIAAGIVHFLVAMGAFVVGSFLAREVRTDRRKADALALWIAAVIVIQTVATGLQYLGVHIFTTSTVVVEDTSLVNRMTGTLSHPSILGKLMFVAVAALLALRPLLKHKRLADFSLVVAFIPLVLTGGRANFVATAVTLTLFALLDRGENRWLNRLRSSLLVAVVLGLSYGYWEQRFVTGENGEVRSHLAAVAWRFLHSAGYLDGSGANTYITAVGPTDALTAAGWPVHNVMLLTLVELGAIGTACLLLPLLAVTIAALGGRRAVDPAGTASRAWLSCLPGLVLICATGWGMLADSLMALMLVVGLLNGLVRHHDEGPTDVAQDSGQRLRVSAES